MTYNWVNTMETADKVPSILIYDHVPETFNHFAWFKQRTVSKKPKIKFCMTQLKYTKKY